MRTFWQTRANSKGPIVRINPHEVHCSDIAFADEIYAVGGRKRNKPLHQINGSAFVTPHFLHECLL
jgi:hypothetical protein